jgi:hypothetical protein
MRPVKLGISAVDFFRENYGVSVIGLRNKGDPLDRFEIGCLGKSDSNAVSGIRTVCYIICPFQARDAGVFDAELFVLEKFFLFTRDHKGFRPGLEIETIITFGQTDYRPAGIKVRPKQHYVSAVEFCNAGIMNRLYSVRNIILCQDGIIFVTPDKFFRHFLSPL